MELHVYSTYAIKNLKTNVLQACELVVFGEEVVPVYHDFSSSFDEAPWCGPLSEAETIIRFHLKDSDNYKAVKLSITEVTEKLF